jgi:hypothetical protein
MAMETKRVKVARGMVAVTKRAIATALTMAMATKTREQRRQEE